MIGLMFLAVISIYIVFNIILIKGLWERFSKKNAIICSLIVLSLPVADDLIGKLVLKTSCENETNVSTQRAIPNIEKIFLFDGVGEESPSYYGYKITEELGYYKQLGYIAEGFEIAQPPKLLVKRVTMSNDANSVIVEEKMEPIAEYGLRVRQSKTFWLDVERFSTINRKGTEELGSFNWFSFRGGWVAHLFSFGGSTSTSCGNSEKIHQKKVELLHATLKPAN